MCTQFRRKTLALLIGLVSGCVLWAGTAYQLITVAGSDLVGDSGPAAAAEVAQPEGLAADKAGNLYIADAANHRVRKVSAAGIIVTVAGNGHPGYSGDNGPAVSAQLNQPYGLALDAAGNLYIADYGNQRVRRIGTDGNISTLAGNGQRGGGGDGGPASSAQLQGPRNVAVDAAGDLYFSEFDGHRVRLVTPDGTITTVAGIGLAGSGGDGGPAVQAQLGSPAGLALDGAGALYIVDTQNVNIRKIVGSTIRTVCVAANFGMPYVQLSGLAADAAGVLYIPESANSFVWQLRPDGTLQRIAGAPGSNVYAGDGQPATKTVLASPVDVALDSAGNLYISEQRRVRQVSAAAGLVSTVAGTGTFGFSGDGGSALSASLSGPAGIAFDGNGNLFVADKGNQRIREVTPDGNIQTVAGSGQTSHSGDGLQATSAGLYHPSAVAFDPAGNLYIADSYNGRVRRVDPTGMISTFAGDGESGGFGAEGSLASLTPLTDPLGVAADGAGHVYVADSGESRVVRIDPDGTIHTAAGTGSPGYTGDGDIASLPELNFPTGIALDGNGNLYIADTMNHRIRMLTPAGVVSTLAGNGTSGFSGDGAAAAAAELNSPCTVAVDTGGNVFIADSGNNRIRLVTPDGNISTIAGTGEATYNGEQGPALQVALENPCGLALDSHGNVLVADSGNNRIRQLTPNQIVIPPPQLVGVSVTSAASLLPGSVTPGEIVALFGNGMGPTAGVSGAFDASGMLSTTLAGVQVLFGNTPAPLFYVQAGQINAQVPYEVAGQSSVQLQIVYQGAPVATTTVLVADASPALFTLNNGAGNVVAVNQDGTINSDQNPAARGSVVILYATGEGQTNPAGATGHAAQKPFPAPLLPVSVTMADINADTLYAGSAPGFVGLMQINAQVPAGFVPAGDLPVVLSIGPYQSQAGITIAVK